MKKFKNPVCLPWEEIFASLGDGLIVLDAERRLMGMNPAAERLVGISAISILGYLLLEAFPQNEPVLQLLKPALDGGRALTLREITWEGRDQRLWMVDLSATPLFDEEGAFDGWILVMRDLTPVKSLQDEVRRADRLAMMGTVAAGLAHEIKNPLGGIKGAAQLLERKSPSAEAEECIGIILRETDRVNRLIGNLLTFTRPKQQALVPIHLNQLLDEVLLLQKEPLAEKSIHVIRHFDPSLPPVLGDNDELHEVFLNLIKNAMEAVPQKTGELHVRSKILSDYKIKGADGKKPFLMVTAEIQDNGPGISRENLDKIFTPFFTTKESGHGLGLAIAQRIINEHGGSLRVRSGTKAEKHGTTIQVVLRSCV